MSIINNNPGLNLAAQIPESIYNDSENFVLFLKAYYEWLQSSTFQLEDIVGSGFAIGEVITGDTSGATARVKLVGDGYIIVVVTSEKNFDKREVISGTSSTTAVLSSITDNVLRRSGNLVEYRSLVNSVDIFAEYLKDELYPNFPTSIYGDNRLVVRKLKDYYQSKGQEQSYKFLFKTLYNQDIDIIFPSEDILRVSDGDWVQSKILRTVVTENIFDFLFKTIRGTTSNAVANVIDIKLVYVGTQQVAEMTLSLVSGTFIVGENIVDVEDITLTTSLYGMITGFTINESGTGYQVGDQLTITGDGQAAAAIVSSIYESPIDSINVVSTGHGYRLGTYAVVNNAGTGGSGLKIKVTGIANTYTVTDGSNNYTVGEVSEVTIVNRGDNYFSSPTITLTDETIRSLGLLSDKLISITASGNNYSVGDWLSFTANTGTSANAIVASVTESVPSDLLFEDNSRLQSETDFDILKQESWSSLGPIERILMTNYGSGYDENDLPVITVNTSTGSNAILTVTGIQGTGSNVQVDAINNTYGIGAIRSVEIQNFGVNYTYANVDCTTTGDGNANISPVLSGIAINTGSFATDDGKISYKKIQDSYYYQDFSYVIRSGIEISRYKETLKSLIHPAGLEVFGEISIISTLNLEMGSSSLINIEKVGNLIDIIISELQLPVQYASSKYNIHIEPQTIDTILEYAASPRVIIVAKPIANDAKLKKKDEKLKKIIVPKFEVSLDYASTKYQIKVEPTKTQTIIDYVESPRVVVTPKGIDPIDVQITKYTVNVLNYNLQANASSSFVPQDVLEYWGNQLISAFSANTISEYPSIRFNSIFNPYDYNALETQVKVNGTVDVYTNNVIFGTGTTFATDFANGDSLIVGNDKFTVNYIVSNTEMNIMVSPQSTYMGQSAYKVFI